MAAVIVDPNKVREFNDFEEFYTWLSEHHGSEQEVWIKLHKVSSGLKSISYKEAIDAALCWGWIDAIKKSFDNQSYLQRFTPRRRKSVWSLINVANVARLAAAKRMTPHGILHVEAAKADGRWDNAYGSGMKLSADLQAAIDASPKAKTMLEKLSNQNRLAIAFRMNTLKTEASRAKYILAIVELLERGEKPRT